MEEMRKICKCAGDGAVERTDTASCDDDDDYDNDDDDDSNKRYIKSHRAWSCNFKAILYVVTSHSLAIANGRNVVLACTRLGEGRELGNRSPSAVPQCAHGHYFVTFQMLLLVELVFCLLPHANSIL